MATQVLGFIRDGGPVRFDIPKVMISFDRHLDAQGMDGRIVLSAGLVDHCLHSHFASFNEIADESFPIVDSHPMMTACASLTWILAHEFFHIVRRHNTVGEKVGNDEITSQAFELDADAMATAALFRTNQLRFNGVLTTLQVRLLTHFQVFSLLRTLPSPGEQSTHSSTFTRLEQVISKLSILTERWDAPNVDTEFERPETIETYDKLIDFHLRVEAAFQNLHGPEKFGSFLSWFMNSQHSDSRYDPVVKWDQIRGDVAKISKSNA